MKVIKPPYHLDIETNSIFLAGSIEMGQAVDWQTQVTNGLSDKKNLTILNPRRDDWDSTWKQDVKNEQFRGQVRWELEAMERASIIAMYFDPKTLSPISLLELGLHAQRTDWNYKPTDSKLVVCCPEGFWRKGNVDVVCERYRIPQVEDLNNLIAYLHNRTN